MLESFFLDGGLKERIFKKNSFYGQPRLQIFGENFCGRGLGSGGNNEPIPEGKPVDFFNPRSI